LPEMNYRKKTMLLKSTPMNQINYDKFNYDYQFIRNMLHLNMGPDEKGNMHYAEIGLQAGVFETDWSWSPLFADFDNDGNKDLFIANGFPGDVTDMDFAHYMNRYQRIVSRRSDLFDTIPEVLIANYIFKNNGDLSFTKMTDEWGLDAKTFSNGAAYADFDGDGDLDLVTNNINQKATLYKNNTLEGLEKAENVNFLSVELEGGENNRNALGAKVLLFAAGQMQFIEHSPSHGFMSSMDGVIHFGIGENTLVDSLVVLWPTGGKSVMRDINANQHITLKYDNDTTFIPIAPYILPRQEQAFQRLQGDKKIEFLHQEKELFDFNLQYTMPHKLSQYTPGIAVSDINGDGLEDIYIGGNKLYSGTFMIQTAEGNFLPENRIISRDTLGANDMGLLFFDADNDGDNDLYIVSGGIEWAVGSASYRDRLYINDGRGNFSYKEDELPDLRKSGSCVKACDFDKDGDLDLFVGTRSKPWAYPMSEASAILINDGGVFRDATKSICPDLSDNLMVTDAIWTDFDNDSWTDLIIVGEWMKITFLKNNNGTFTDVSDQLLKEPSSGWWNCITGTDIDNDGDIDYICGNLGLNSIFKGDAQYPLSIYASDFDRNGMIDPIVVRYNSDENFDKKPFPIHTRDGMLQQVSFLFQRVKTYNAFGKSTIHDLFTTEELENAYHLEGNYFKSACLINDGAGKFHLKPLPNEAQIAPIFGILPQDFNDDGKTDLLLIGNDYSIELMTGRIDASPGIYLTGKGNSEFTFHKPYQSGFRVTGDAKGIAAVFDKDGLELILTTQNKDSLITHTWSSTQKPTIIDPGTALWGELLMVDGSRSKQEFYYGSTYLSQSSRRLIIPKNCNKVILHYLNGATKEIDF
jgi:enediyne biosynthesis protein E4